MRQTGWAKALSAATAATVAAGLLAGCAALPADRSWAPPAWPESAAVTVLTSPDARSGSHRADSSALESAVAPAVAADLSEIDTAGLVDGRVRNDRAGLQARYVEVQGIADFNARVAELLASAIASTGESKFTPEVFEASAGLADRGCVAGSAELPAADLLADPEIGPAGGDGTAVVCQVVSAFGPVLGVSFRTVTGSADAVESDQTTVLFADFEANAAVEAAAMWTPEAAAELWDGAVHSLAREAGALSAAPMPPANDEQLALATTALGTAQIGPDSMRFTLPAGVASDELAALGVPATSAPLSVTIPGEAAPAGWVTPAGEQLLAHRGTAFAGVPAWNAAHAVDCDIVACVAVTYDDGPSGFTAELLDTLAAHESAATFFMLGKAVAGAADIVARAAHSGHELASHSMTHPDLTTISPRAARKEILGAGKKLTEVTGQPVTTYRPPYGALNDSVLSAVGLPAILWTIDTLDWQQPGEAELIERSASVAKPGDIILFHDTHADTVNAAGDVLEGLKNRGLTPVTVTQLFEGEVPEGRVSGR